MKILKNIFILALFIGMGCSVFAGNAEDARAFFDKYINAANSYSTTVPSMYSPKAVIIRQVIKPDGTTADAYFTNAQYQKQLKISSAIAKQRKYKNNYSNIKVNKINETTYRIDAIRKPSLGGDNLKTSTTVQKQPDGKWLIVKELMQTREQIFLKYVKK